MRSFYMVRHGETTTNLDKIATGQMDVLLTPKGIEQAEKCRKVIDAHSIHPDIILCSGLQRTKQTAEIINKEIKSPLHQHSELNEQSYGDWEGQEWADVHLEIEKYGENPINGETKIEFIERIVSAFEKLLCHYDEETILFVTHAGVFEALLSKYKYRHEKIKNGVLYYIQFSESGDELLNFDLVSE